MCENFERDDFFILGSTLINWGKNPSRIYVSGNFTFVLRYKLNWKLGYPRMFFYPTDTAFDCCK